MGMSSSENLQHVSEPRKLFPFFILELFHLNDPNTTCNLITNQKCELFILRTEQNTLKHTLGAFSQRALYNSFSLLILDLRAETDIDKFTTPLKRIFMSKYLD